MPPILVVGDDEDIVFWIGPLIAGNGVGALRGWRRR
jgi:hypothetical protein